MSSQRARRTGALAGAAAVFPLAAAPAAFGAVSLTLGDKDATPTSTAVTAGASFPVDVFLNLGATSDRVSGIDYRLQASVANQFRILSRTSTAVFTPLLADSNPAVAPITLTPTNGAADLGGDRNGNADLAGVNTYEVADYVVQALAGTPNGTYTLGFVAASTSYGGAGPTFPTLQFAQPLGTFTVTVPEPMTATGVFVSALAVVGLGRPRRRADAPVG